MFFDKFIELEIIREIAKNTMVSFPIATDHKCKFGEKKIMRSGKLNNDKFESLAIFLTKIMRLTQPQKPIKEKTRRVNGYEKLSKFAIGKIMKDGNGVPG